jgi:hypothetical protein
VITISELIHLRSGSVAIWCARGGLLVGGPPGRTMGPLTSNVIIAQIWETTCDVNHSENMGSIFQTSVPVRASSHHYRRRQRSASRRATLKCAAGA